MIQIRKKILENAPALRATEARGPRSLRGDWRQGLGRRLRPMVDRRDRQRILHAREFSQRTAGVSQSWLLFFIVDSSNIGPITPPPPGGPR